MKKTVAIFAASILVGSAGLAMAQGAGSSPGSSTSGTGAATSAGATGAGMNSMDGPATGRTDRGTDTVDTGRPGTVSGNPTGSMKTNGMNNKTDEPPRGTDR